MDGLTWDQESEISLLLDLVVFNMLAMETVGPNRKHVKKIGEVLKETEEERAENNPMGFNWPKLD